MNERNEIRNALRSELGSTPMVSDDSESRVYENIRNTLTDARTKAFNAIFFVVKKVRAFALNRIDRTAKQTVT